MHAREQIRAAVVTAVTGLTATSNRVYESRVLPMAHGGLPALCVYTRSDVVSYPGGTMGGRPLRILEVHVEGYVDGDDQSVMDDIAEQVEAAIYSNSALQTLVKRRVWMGDQTMTTDDQGSKLVSRIDMAFNAEYSTGEGSPATIV